MEAGHQLGSDEHKAQVAAELKALAEEKRFVPFSERARRLGEGYFNVTQLNANRCFQSFCKLYRKDELGEELLEGFGTLVHSECDPDTTYLLTACDYLPTTGE